MTIPTARTENLIKDTQYHGLVFEMLDLDTRLVQVTSVLESTAFQLSVALFRQGDRVLVSGGVSGTLALAAAMGAGARNVALYEPNFHFVGQAADQLRVDGVGMDVVWGALDVREGTRGIFIHEPWGNVSFEPGDYIAGMDVPTVNTNDLVARRGITAISLVVRGAEFDVIPHLNLLPIRVLLVKIHGGGEKTDRLIAGIESQGLRSVLSHADEDGTVVGFERTD